MKIGYNMFVRLSVAAAAVVALALLLMKGVYGSFLFSFSISLLWQIGFRGEKLHSLGLKTLILAIILAGLLSVIPTILHIGHSIRVLIYTITTLTVP